MLLVPLLTSPLEEVSLELVELLEDVVPALLLDVVPSVEAVLEPAVATRAPAPASEVSTAPPAMTARTRPTRRVLRVRPAARSSAVGAGGGGGRTLSVEGGLGAHGDGFFRGSGGGEGVRACGGDGSGAAGPALGRSAAAGSGELAVRRRRAGLRLLLGCCWLVLGPALGLALLRLGGPVLLVVGPGVLAGGLGDRPGLVVVAAGVGGLGGDADGDRGADGTERAGSDHSAAGGGRAPHLPVAVEGAA